MKEQRGPNARGKGGMGVDEGRAVDHMAEMLERREGPA